MIQFKPSNPFISISTRANTSNSTIGSGNSVVVCGNEDWDDLGCYNSTTGTYTVAVAGKYEITCYAEFAAFASWGANEACTMTLLKNSSGAGTMGRFVMQATINNTVGLLGTTTATCAVGDTLQVAMAQNNGSNRGLNSATNMTFKRIGD